MMAVNKNSTTVNLYELKLQVREAAAAAGVSMSTWVYWAVRDKLKQEVSPSRPAGHG